MGAVDLMAGKVKPLPKAVFDANIGDAERLIGFARALTNNRKRRMRRELRDSVGDVIGIPRRDREQLDCIESDDVFIVLKPGGSVKRAHFEESELRPLLRQSIVAISAAVESYVAEKAKSLIGEALTTLPDRMRGIQIELGDVLEIEKKYKRTKWGYRELLETYFDQEASSDPHKMAIVFSTVGKKDVLKKVDAKRGVAKGVTSSQLEALYQRRNLIAHTGDRKGRGRAALTLAEVEVFRANAISIITALEAVL